MNDDKCDDDESSYRNARVNVQYTIQAEWYVHQRPTVALQVLADMTSQ